jgi:hypothetical protein
LGRPFFLFLGGKCKKDSIAFITASILLILASNRVILDNIFSILESKHDLKQFYNEYLSQKKVSKPNMAKSIIISKN